MMGPTPRILVARTPLLVALALVLAIVGASSSLAKLLPFDVTAFPAGLWLFLSILAALVPAWLARGTPLPAAAFVVVPILAAGAYGASRLDWLRVLKDFDVAEPSAIAPRRLILAALALVLLWALHASDVALRLRDGAVARGIEAPQASAASRQSVRRSAEAGGLALAGSAGLLLVGIAGLALSRLIPTGRGALVAPLLAAAILVGAATWIARDRKEIIE